MRHHVIIKPEHCLNTHFMSTEDCPLARAIREQKPELGIDIGVGGITIDFYDVDKICIPFNEKDWNYEVMENLKHGHLEKVDIYFNI
jgi:hypothetical protein